MLEVYILTEVDIQSLIKNISAWLWFKNNYVFCIKFRCKSQSNRLFVASNRRYCVKMVIKVNINPRLQSWDADNQQDSINRLNGFELASMFSHSFGSWGDENNK